MTDLSWYAAASARARLRRVLDDLKRVRVDGAALYSMRLMENVENEVGQVIASLEDDDALYTYVIRYSGDAPQSNMDEIESIWVDRIEAHKRLDELNDGRPEIPWYIDRIEAKHQWRPGE